MKRFFILIFVSLFVLALCFSCKSDPATFNNIPTLHLHEPTDLLRTSVTLHGSLTTNYPDHIRECGFLFGSTSDFSGADTQTIAIDYENLRDLSTSLTGLKIGGTYFYALYADNGTEKLLSVVKSLTLPTRSEVMISNFQIDDINTFKVSARISDTGGGDVTSVGFCWGTTKNPTIFSGEHLFATLDKDNTFKATLPLKKGKKYYVLAFAESDITDSGSSTVSYSSEELEVYVSLEPTVEIMAGEARASSLTFYIISHNADKVSWMAVPKPSDDKLSISAEMVLASGNNTEPNNEVMVTASDLEPETTYWVYAAAKNTEKKALSQPIEMTTSQAPTIALKPGESTDTSLSFSIATTNAQYAAWQIFTPEELALYGTPTDDVLLGSGNFINTDEPEITVTAENLTPDTTYTIYAVALNDDLSASVMSEKLVMTTDVIEDWSNELVNFNEMTVESNDTSHKVTLSSTANEEMVFFIEGVESIYEKHLYVGKELTQESYIYLMTDNNNEKYKVYGDGYVMFHNVVDTFNNYIIAYTGSKKDPAGDSRLKFKNDAKIITFDSGNKGWKVTLADLPTVTLKAINSYPTELLFSVTTENTERAAWLVLSPAELSSFGTMTADKVLSSGESIENNKEVEIRVEELTPETTYTIYAAAEKAGVKMLSEKLEMTTEAGPTNCVIYYTSTDEKIVNPNIYGAFGSNIVSNTYENGQGVILFDGPVTSIGNYAFYNGTDLTSITIPDSVTSIGDWAFYGCTNLTNITFSDGVVLIGESAFNGCSGLIHVYLGNSVTSIGRNAFRGCNSLTSVDLSNSLTSIGPRAFADCNSLANITIPESVISIGSWAFIRCHNLTSITIPDSVTSIGGEVFLDCQGLTAFYGKYTSSDNRCLIIDGGVKAFATAGLIEYTIPDEVTSIIGGAFTKCSLESITIPKTVTSFTTISGGNSGAFYQCPNLKRVYCKSTTPPTGVNRQSFWNNGYDIQIYVPNASVDAYKTFDGWDFYADYIYPMDPVEATPKTREIYYTSTDGNVVEPYKTNAFGANIVSNSYENGQGVILFDGPVTSIGSSAFWICSNLKSIILPTGVTSIESFAFYNCSNLTDISFPEGIISIEDSAFHLCTSLTDVTIPDSVTSIGSSIFAFCTSLTSVIIPSGITSIGNCTFSSCSSLTNVTIPDSVTSIGVSAFYNCTNLISVTIPIGIISIGETAFSDCNSLKSVYCKPATPPMGGSNMFYSNAMDRKIYVPNASVSAYKAAEDWSDYATDIVGYDF